MHSHNFESIGISLFYKSLEWLATLSSSWPFHTKSGNQSWTECLIISLPDNNYTFSTLADEPGHVRDVIKDPDVIEENLCTLKCL